MLSRRQKSNLNPSFSTRGATISCTRPKYDVVARAASKAAWLAKLCVSDAVAALAGARVEHVVQLRRRTTRALAAEAEALVGAQRQQVEHVGAIGAARIDRDAARALRERHAQRAVERQAAQRLVVRAEVDAPRRLVAAEQLEGVRLVVGAAALARPNVQQVVRVGVVVDDARRRAVGVDALLAPSSRDHTYEPCICQRFDMRLPTEISSAL